MEAERIGGGGRLSTTHAARHVATAFNAQYALGTVACAAPQSEGS